MNDEPYKTRKKCFVIGPIGKPDSEDRKNADWVLRGIVRPALESEPFEYDVSRADEGQPGPITAHTINSILGADLIVADLTSQNPNAFYELGIAHMAEKPVIQLITLGEEIPFDVQDERTVFYDRTTVDGVEDAKRVLIKHAKTFDDQNFTVSNPITAARGHRQLKESTDSRDQFLADMSDTLGRVSARLEILEAGRRPPTLAELNTLFDSPDDFNKNRLLDHFVGQAEEDRRRAKSTRSGSVFLSDTPLPPTLIPRPKYSTEDPDDDQD